ncbi:TolC family protein [Ottowia thiooxydans]|uniref:TolC family protein n=1 Tax=Ottowia thiooxydans TaxID=219182 RepID=UPI00041451BA|nr:TolC family protein [Ottowia thiooxydans]
MPCVRLIVSCIALGLLGACAAPTPQLAPPRPDAAWYPNAPQKDFVLPSQPALAELAATPDVDPSRLYSLAELIDLAQRNHPATRIAWIAAKNAATTAGIAQRSWLPRLSATVLAGARHRQGDAGGQSVSIESERNGHAAAGVLSLQWLLFDFGERAAIAQGAEHEAMVANIGFTAAHQQIIEAVSLAYYSHGAARARIGVAQGALANSREILEAAQARFKQGIGTVIEVAHAKQAVAQAEFARVQAQGRERDTYHSLIAAMGISPLTPLKLAEAPTPRLGLADKEPIERLVADALARRPDIQAAYATLQASRAGARASEAARMPKVFLAASASRSSGANVTTFPSAGQDGPTLNLAGSGSGVGAFIGVTVPLWDGQTRSSMQMQAQQRVEAAQARLDRVRQQAVQQIVVAQDALFSALASVQAATELRLAAGVTQDAASDAYRHGVGTVTAATLAETQLIEAGQLLADARAAAQSAAVTLALATGALGSAPAP